jgi:L-fuconolactonase
MNSDLHRREFLKRTSSAMTVAAGAGLLGLAGGSEGSSLAAASERKDQPVTDAVIPIIDTHQHLWDLDKFNLPWVKKPGADPLNRSFVTSDYLAATAGLNVVKTVYMEVDLDPAQHREEAEYVLELCRQEDNPMQAAVISGRPNSKEFRDYIAEYKDNPYIKGVRQILHADSAPRGLCLQRQFVDSMKLLGDWGLSFDLCMRPGEIIDGVELVDQCPQTRFIIDHCGNMSVQSTDQEQRNTWMRGMREMANRKNVVCKISGIVVTAKKDEWQPADLAPNVNFCLDTFGEDRVFFAGDWPVCTLTATFKQWVDALKWIVRDRSPEFQKKLFHDNAEKYYGLS